MLRRPQRVHDDLRRRRQGGLRGLRRRQRREQRRLLLGVRRPERLHLRRRAERLHHGLRRRNQGRLRGLRRRQSQRQRRLRLLRRHAGLHLQRRAERLALDLHEPVDLAADQREESDLSRGHASLPTCARESSDRPTSGYEEREFAADALAVMDATETQRAVLVSLSLGAQRALLLAADFMASQVMAVTQESYQQIESMGR